MTTSSMINWEEFDGSSLITPSEAVLLSRTFTTSAGEPTARAAFALRGSGVQIPSAPLGNADQGHDHRPRRLRQDPLSLRCHRDRASACGVSLWRQPVASACDTV